MRSDVKQQVHPSAGPRMVSWQDIKGGARGLCIGAQVASEMFKMVIMVLERN